MEHFAPHPTAPFEGYYSKFSLPDHAHLALIISSVPAAHELPANVVSFTYYPSSGSPIFQREVQVSAIHRIETNEKTHAFELRVPGMGFMRVDVDAHGEETTTYELGGAEEWGWELKGVTQKGGRIPWRSGDRKSTPEGLLVRLPLPLHWHVHSLGSPLPFFSLKIPSLDLHINDSSGTPITVHQEKNWAHSFPQAHMWIQARDHFSNTGICLAGGKILGLTAYMLAFRSSSLNVDFIPPFTVSMLLPFLNINISPFMIVNVDWPNRAFELSVSGFWKRITIKARAPKEEGWFRLASPFPEGHRNNFLTESFRADVEVTVSERGWLLFGGWREVRRERFAGASLEFGGGYFAERGKETWVGKMEVV